MAAIFLTARVDGFRLYQTKGDQAFRSILNYIWEHNQMIGATKSMTIWLFYLSQIVKQNHTIGNLSNWCKFKTLQRIYWRSDGQIYQLHLKTYTKQVFARLHPYPSKIKSGHEKNRRHLKFYAHTPVHVIHKKTVKISITLWNKHSGDCSVNNILPRSWFDL